MSSTALHHIEDLGNGHQEKHHGKDWLGLVLAVTAAISGYNVAVSSERFILGWLEVLFADNNLIPQTTAVKLMLGIISLALGMLGIWLFRRELESSSRGWRDRDIPFLTLLSGAAQALSFRRASSWWNLCWLAFTVLLVAVPLHWFASIVSTILTGVVHHGHGTVRDGMTVVAGLVVFLASSYVLKRNFVHQATLIPSMDEAPYEALALFLSNPLPPANSTAAQRSGASERPPTSSDPARPANRTAEGRVPTGSPEEFREYVEGLDPISAEVFGQGYAPLQSKCKHVFPNHNWLMPTLSVLRQAQLAKLKHVLLICSLESAEFAKDFEKWIQKNLQSAGVIPPEFHVIPNVKGIDFGNSEQLQVSVDKCYEKIEGLKLDNALLDVTGGTKECSIVGAIRSFPVGRAILYISTKDYAIRQFHPIIEQHTSDAASH